MKEENENLDFYIVVGSKSQIKINAIKDALCEIGSSYNFVLSGYNISSDVSDQPFDKEGPVGANNRAYGAALEFLKNNKELDVYQGLAIGIENYIEHEISSNNDKLFKDLAALCVFTLPIEKEAEYFYSEEAIYYTEEHVEEAKKLNTTVGKVLASKNIVKYHDDPHLDLIGKSRRDILKDLLKVIFKKLIKK